MIKPPIKYTSSRHIPIAIQRYVSWRDGGICILCKSDGKTNYDHDPAWELLVPKRHDPDKIFLLCEPCHSVKTHKSDRPNIRRAVRLNKKHNGEAPKPKSKIKSRGFQKGIKVKIKSRGFNKNKPNR